MGGVGPSSSNNAFATDFTGPDVGFFTSTDRGAEALADTSILGAEAITLVSEVTSTTAAFGDDTLV